MVDKSDKPGDGKDFRNEAEATMPKGARWIRIEQVAQLRLQGEEKAAELQKDMKRLAVLNQKGDELRKRSQKDA